MRNQIRAEIAAIEPFDELEHEHISKALSWVDSGAELCRIAKPATPPIHLVSYFVLIDCTHVLLVDHRQAQLWLPTGGHVEPGEHPQATVLREIKEELGISALEKISPPLMITYTPTAGLAAGHTDVSLWFVLQGSREQPLQFDTHEFNRVQWFPFAEVPFERSDPHMGRFLRKLAQTRSVELPHAC
jgi:8-oxo-dGTP diphosphatase